MAQKLAIAVIHGIGLDDPKFQDETSSQFVGGMKKPLISEFARLRRETFDEAESKLVIKPIYWAEIIQDLQDELGSTNRLNLGRLSNPLNIRNFLFHYLGDAIAYSASGSKKINEKIYTVFAETLKILAQEAAEKAPLCIIGHSLGGVIASDYIWDLQKGNPIITIGNTALEQGETLTLFYTLGTQIAIWSISHQDFGEPIKVPSPKLGNHYSGLRGEWINFYDKDDVLGYPVQKINPAYSQVVIDREVNAGNIFTSWNPLSHNGYWKDDEVIEPIAKALVTTWEAINN